MRSQLAVLLAAMSALVGCDDSINCGDRFIYDETRMRCACGPDLVELEGGACMLPDGGVIIPPGFDAGTPPDDARVPQIDAQRPDTGPTTECMPASEEACPDGTSVGECSRGTRTCSASGEWQECTGALSATPELCDNLDNDCDAIIDGPDAAADCGTADRATDITCVAGTCRVLVCDVGYGDCDETFDNGCETSLGGITSCGACGSLCGWECDDTACNDAVQIAAGWTQTCALRQDGVVACWGRGEYGELANGASGSGTSTRALAPITALGPGTDPVLDQVTQISGTWDHLCGVRTDGRVVCWGRNNVGQIGTGSTSAAVARPTFVVAPGAGDLAGVAQVGTGSSHSCARLSAGQVYCWGGGTGGQLGFNMMRDSTRPVQVVARSGGGPLSGVAEIAVGVSGSCAITSAGAALCWGFYGGTANTLRPTPLPGVGGSGELSGVRAIALGSAFGCAILALDGSVVCWGDNDEGQLGRGTTSAADSNPAPVLGVGGVGTLSSVEQITASGDRVCARVASGETVCWGDGGGGLGRGATPGDFRVPGVVAGTDGTGSLPATQAITTGWNHSCAIADDPATVYCWGGGNEGQLGFGGSIPAGAGSSAVVTLPPT